MSEHVFSVDKIESNFKNVDFFSGIEEGLKEAIAYERDSANARTFSKKKPFRNKCQAEVQSL